MSACAHWYPPPSHHPSPPCPLVFAPVPPSPLPNPHCHSIQHSSDPHGTAPALPGTPHHSTAHGQGAAWHGRPALRTCSSLPAPSPPLSHRAGRGGQVDGSSESSVCATRHGRLSGHLRRRHLRALPAHHGLARAACSPHGAC
ncbi:unnamed protein product [Closterium sp. NIES-54]